MSIQSEISRIQSNVQDTINVIQSTGVAVPPGANSDNLPGLATALANEKQDKLTGTPGQIVGFDSQGNAVAQSPTSSGVTSFEGRTGAVTARQGDYTAAMVGAVPTTRTVNGKALSADVEIGAGDVSYDNSETSAIITGDNVQSAIDQLFTSVSDGKTLVAAAITDKGVATAETDSFAQMAANIGQIPTGSTYSETSDFSEFALWLIDRAESDKFGVIVSIPDSYGVITPLFSGFSWYDEQGMSSFGSGTAITTLEDFDISLKITGFFGGYGEASFELVIINSNTYDDLVNLYCDMGGVINDENNYPYIFYITFFAIR